jgi:hypothetical protein
MSTDQNVLARIAEWLESLWRDPAAAAEFAESPDTSLASHDLSQSDLDGVDLRGVAGGLGGSGHFSPDGRHALQQFSSSPPPVHHVTPVQEVAFVTREVHHDNPVINKIFNDNSVNIDNSQNVFNQGGFIGGDITFDSDVTIASGDGAVAAGEGADVNAATGDGAVANVGGEVNQASGAGSQVIDGGVGGNNASNSDGAIQAGDDVEGANSGVNTGVVGGDDVEGTIVGDDNQQASVDGDVEDSAIGFGEGDTANTSDNVAVGSTVNSGGDSQGVIGNSADDGGAIGGRDASGTDVQDGDTSVENVNTSIVDDSINADVAQDDGVAVADQEFGRTVEEVDQSTVAGDDVNHTLLDA